MIEEDGISFFATVDSSDQRGRSYSAPESAIAWLGRVADVHAATIASGTSRGGHFHRQKREVLVVAWDANWEFEWSRHGRTGRRLFEGTGSIAIGVSPGVWHRLVNAGAKPVLMVALSDEPYSTANPDSVTQP